MRLPEGKIGEFFISAGYSFTIIFVIDKKRQIILLKQYYISQQRKIYSLAAGIIDQGETAVASAKRELLEETGYRAKRIISLGSGNKGKYATGAVHYFLAIGARKIKEPEFEEAEDIKVVKLSLGEFKKLLGQKKLPDALAEVGAYRALKYLENHNL